MFHCNELAIKRDINQVLISQFVTFCHYHSTHQMGFEMAKLIGLVQLCYSLFCKRVVYKKAAFGCSNSQESAVLDF